MRALILAAGLGTRLLPLTARRPKCLTPVMNRTLLDFWLENLAGLGVERAVVNTHHLAPLVAAHLAARTAAGPEVIQSHEPVILGTGGALTQAGRWLGDEPHYLVNADVVAALPLAGLRHALEGSAAAAALALVDEPRFNTVAVSPEGRVLGFRGDAGLPPDVRWRTYTGLAVISPRLGRFLPPAGQPGDLVAAFRAALAAGEAILGLEPPGFWDDLGTPERLWALHDRLATHPPAGLEHLAPATLPLVGPGAVLDPGARVEGWAVLGPGARVAAGAVVERAILFPGAEVGPGGTARRAILGDGCRLEGLAQGGAHV